MCDANIISDKYSVRIFFTEIIAQYLLRLCLAWPRTINGGLAGNCVPTLGISLIPAPKIPVRQVQKRSASRRYHFGRIFSSRANGSAVQMLTAQLSYKWACNIEMLKQSHLRLTFTLSAQCLIQVSFWANFWLNVWTSHIANNGLALCVASCCQNKVVCEKFIILLIVCEKFILLPAFPRLSKTQVEFIVQGNRFCFVYLETAQSAFVELIRRTLLSRLIWLVRAVCVCVLKQLSHSITQAYVEPRGYGHVRSFCRQLHGCNKHVG